MNPQAWISAKDKLPEEKKEVAVWLDEGDGCPTYEIAYFGDGKFYIGGEKVSVNHWFPLPAPPQE